MEEHSRRVEPVPEDLDPEEIIIVIIEDTGCDPEDILDVNA